MPYGGTIITGGAGAAGTEGKAVALDGKTVCLTDSVGGPVNVFPSSGVTYDSVSILNGTGEWVRAIVVTDPSVVVNGNKTGLVPPNGGGWAFATAGTNAVSGIILEAVEAPTLSAGICVDPLDLTGTVLAPLCSACVAIEFLEQ